MPTSADSSQGVGSTAGVAVTPESLPGTEGPTDRAFKAVGEAMDYVPDQVSSRIAEFAGKHGVNPYVAAVAATPFYFIADPLNAVGGKAAKGGVELAEQAGRAAGLAMDQPSRMKRAAEMGFDTAKKWYHGTAANFKEFADTSVESAKKLKDKFGITHDRSEQLLYGPGHYFTDHPAVASEYAENAAGHTSETLASGLDREGAFRRAEELSKQHGLTYADPAKRNDISVQVRGGGGGYSVEGYLHPDANVVEARLKHGNFFPIDETIRPGQYAALIDSAGIHGTPEAMALVVGKPHGIRGGDLYRYLNESTGLSKRQINDALQKAGYDGIEHEGGKIMGKQKHKVKIVFDPADIRSPNAVFDPAKEKSRNILASTAAATAGGVAATQGEDNAQPTGY